MQIKKQKDGTRVLETDFSPYSLVWNDGDLEHARVLERNDSEGTSTDVSVVMRLSSLYRSMIRSAEILLEAEQLDANQLMYTAVSRGIERWETRLREYGQLIQDSLVSYLCSCEMKGMAKGQDELKRTMFLIIRSWETTPGEREELEAYISRCLISSGYQVKTAAPIPYSGWLRLW